MGKEQKKRKGVWDESNKKGSGRRETYTVNTNSINCSTITLHESTESGQNCFPLPSHFSLFPLLFVSVLVGVTVWLWNGPHTHNWILVSEFGPMSCQVLEALRGVTCLVRDVQGRGFEGFSLTLDFLVPVISGISNRHPSCSERYSAFSVVMDCTTAGFLNISLRYLCHRTRKVLVTVLLFAWNLFYWWLEETPS